MHLPMQFLVEFILLLLRTNASVHMGRGKRKQGSKQQKRRHILAGDGDLHPNVFLP